MSDLQMEERIGRNLRELAAAVRISAADLDQATARRPRRVVPSVVVAVFAALVVVAVVVVASTVVGGDDRPPPATPPGGAVSYVPGYVPDGYELLSDAVPPYVACTRGRYSGDELECEEASGFVLLTYAETRAADGEEGSTFFVGTYLGEYAGRARMEGDVDSAQPIDVAGHDGFWEDSADGIFVGWHEADRLVVVGDEASSGERLDREELLRIAAGLRPEPIARDEIGLAITGLDDDDGADGGLPTYLVARFGADGSACAAPMFLREAEVCAGSGTLLVHNATALGDGGLVWGIVTTPAARVLLERSDGSVEDLELVVGSDLGLAGAFFVGSQSADDVGVALVALDANGVELARQPVRRELSGDSCTQGSDATIGCSGSETVGATPELTRVSGNG